MLPMLALRLQIGELLAADDTTLAPAANANKMALIAAAFTPDEGLEEGDLTYASFDGSTPITGVVGTQQAGVDPATLDQIVTIKEPAGGWRWESTGVTNLPQTIYGFALLDNALAVLLAVASLDEPVTITAAGQEINLGACKLTIVQQPVS